MKGAKVVCPICGRLLSRSTMTDHFRTRHPAQLPAIPAGKDRLPRAWWEQYRVRTEVEVAGLPPPTPPMRPVVMAEDVVRAVLENIFGPSMPTKHAAALATWYARTEEFLDALQEP